MKTLFNRALILLSSAQMFFSVATVAASATDNKPVEHVSQPHSKYIETTLGEIQAIDYGLTETELTRYYEIMQGPLGRWYRNLDPTWVLGFASETEKERRHFAALAAEMEFQRVENELAFNRAFSEAVAARTTASSMIDDALWARRKAPGITPHANAGRENRRWSLFVDGGCFACDSVVQEELRSVGLASVDIYLANMADDESIRRWAQRLGIDVDAVKARRITLNHDVGAFSNQLSAEDSVVVFYQGPFGPIRRSVDKKR